MNPIIHSHNAGHEDEQIPRSSREKEKFSTHRMCRVFRTKVGENAKRSLGTGVVKYHATGY